MTNNPVCVLTTIHSPGMAVHSLEGHFTNGNLIVIGDGKTPKDWRYGQADYYSLDRQVKLPFALLRYLPENHYARKNIGYLIAMTSGAGLVYDTDDDNVPNSAWRLRDATCTTELVEEPGWCNTYALFSKAEIWPRGFPLERVRASYVEPSDRLHTVRATVRCPVQQGVADQDPDVDAVFRLLAGTPDVTFRQVRSVALGPFVWCPFNSQSTWWWPEAYPLLYLPVHATFRMTDIWRSFVAQRCLWELGLGVAHHSPAEVEQVRNPHDLLRDFADEVPGYLNNERIARVLDDLVLRGDVCDNLVACYIALIEVGILPESELPAVCAWVSDVQELTPSSPGSST